MAAQGPIRAAASTRDDWETPWPLFNELNREFRFTLDAAAACHNRKCARYLTEAENAVGANGRAPGPDQPCRVCARPMTAEGVFVTDDQRWCRPCASTLRDLLNILLLGDAE